jgi:hypothetical protein
MKIYLVTQIGSAGFDPQLTKVGGNNRLVSYFDLRKMPNWTREDMEYFIKHGVARKVMEK